MNARRRRSKQRVKPPESAAPDGPVALKSRKLLPETETPLSPPGGVGQASSPWQDLLAGRHLPAALLTLICALSLLHVRIANFVSDDSFITFRYARSLARGTGLTYNPGERVEGFSSPLWTIIVSIFEGFGFAMDPPLLARTAGAAFGVLALIFAWRLAVLLSGERFLALSVPLVLAANGSWAVWAGSGMETPLYVFLVVASVYTTLAGRPLLQPALWCSLCIWARPEGVMIFAILSSWHLLMWKGDRRSDLLWKWFVPCSLALFALFAFRSVYFGEWLPNTYYVKSGGGFDQVLRGWRYFSSYAADHEGLILIALPALVFLILGDGRRRFISLSALALWGAAIWVGGDGLPMFRFALTPLPFLCILLYLLAHRALTAAGALNRNLGRGLGVCLAAGTALWVAVHLSPPITRSYYFNYTYQKNVEIPRWIAAGEWLRENSRPGDSVALVPIGAVGYYSGLKVYDMLGLTDRHIARLTMTAMGKGWAGHEKHDGQYILDQEPTYLLLGNIDVTRAPRDPEGWPFIPYTVNAILAREKDMYDSDIIRRMYRPRSAKLAEGQFLNFYELREEYRGG